MYFVHHSEERVCRVLERRAIKQLLNWKNSKSRKALLVDGARQVGKTYLIRKFAEQSYHHVVEINLLEVEGAAEAFRCAKSSDDLFSRITLYANDKLVSGETLIFIDEVQEALEMITAAKFLIEKTGEQFDYVFSGSMLGVELKGIKSWPVGFLREVTLYPLDFEEFCWANGMAPAVLDAVREAMSQHEPVDPFVHERLLSLFYYYLAVGGMPEAVVRYLESKNLQEVRETQNDIIVAYRHDIAKYCPNDALFVKAVFDGMSAQLNQQNKRYVVSSVEKSARMRRDENKFLWLAEANVALPVCNVDEPRFPLEMSRDSSLFKLFMSDVGLLAYASGMETVRRTLNREPANYGAVYENFVAQELVAHGFKPYYFRSKKMGELDFLVEWPSGVVLPIEVKSGKDYRRHRALRNVLSVSNYGIERAVVFCDDNVSEDGAVLYLPIYMVSLLSREEPLR